MTVSEHAQCQDAEAATWKYIIKFYPCFSYCDMFKHFFLSPLCGNKDLLSTNLIGQAVQRTSQTVHGSAEGQVGVRQGTTHQVAGVSADISSFMVTVTFKKA